jgi:formylaminopyrimidine deformylase
VAEPSSFSVTWCLPGAVYLRLTTRGRPVYTPFTRRNEQGVSHENAIVAMIPVLQAIERWGVRYQKERRYAFPGGEIIPKVNIGAIEGGLPIKPNYSPALCHAYVDVRIPPGMKPLEACREVEAAVQETGIPVEIDMYLSQPGSEGKGVEPLKEAVEGAHQSVFGAPPGRISSEQTSMWNDVNIYNWYGIPSLKYGPSGITYGEKKREERMAIEDLVRASQVYALSAATICSQKRDR